MSLWFLGLVWCIGAVLPCRVIHGPAQRSRTDDHRGNRSVLELMHRSSLHLGTASRNLDVACFLKVVAASARYFGVQGIRRAYHATVASSSFSTLLCLGYVYHVNTAESLGVNSSATINQTISNANLQRMAVGSDMRRPAR